MHGLYISDECDRSGNKSKGERISGSEKVCTSFIIVGKLNKKLYI